MPSPKTPRRVSKRLEPRSAPTASKPTDLGSPLGPYDTNTVRDRIRQWQASGGGVITADDIFVEVKEEVSHSSKKTSRNNENDDEYADVGGVGKRRRRNRREDDHAKDDLDDATEKTAPKKRVVSDTHWQRKTATSSKAADNEGKDNINNRRNLPDDGIRIKPFETPSPTKSGRNQEKLYPAEPSRSPFDDGIRVYSTPTGSRRTSRNLSATNNDKRQSDLSDDSQKSHDSDSLRRKRSSKRSKEPVRERPSKVASAYKSNDGKIFGHRKEETPENLSSVSGSDAFPNVRVSTKGQRSNILSQVLSSSKKIFLRTEPIPVPARLPTIETWLDGMPDPFVDSREAPVEVPLPEKRCAKATLEEAIVIPPDPNKIWDTLDQTEERIGSSIGQRKRREHASAGHGQDGSRTDEADGFHEGPPSKRHISPSGIAAFKEEPKESPQESSQNSPTSLRRRGARKDIISPKADCRRASTQQDSPSKQSSPLRSASRNEALDSIGHNISKSSPRSNTKRPSPHLGTHPLSTIASAETLNVIPVKSSIGSLVDKSAFSDAWREEKLLAETRDTFDPSGLDRTTSKTRSIRHSDLMSILSMPGESKSTRSMRTGRSKLATATMTDVLTDFEADEIKYMREIRTLVDGVIPVLLSCVLSKSDSAVAAGLFQPNGSAQDAEHIIKPIVNMGIALERLKSLHRRAPKQNSQSLYTWAQGGLQVYTDYIKSWRMGFQDVVVNLAAASDDSKASAYQSSGGKDADEGLLPRNEDGDVVNANGERVDVAFLLKRPLVRLKYISKTLRSLNDLTPSTEAANLAASYQALVIDARNRSNEERARLEDEAAAAIDPTRVRDPKTLGPLAGVTIDGTRRVHARDYFGLTLQHSNAQRIDCRVELLLRDGLAGRESGDVLLCEVDGTGRWLLFPPINFADISARNGDMKGEMIVMLRESTNGDAGWHELLSLHREDEQTTFEWVQMLGLNPVPPRIQRSLSFLTRYERKPAAPVESCLEFSVVAEIGRLPSPTELDIPIGEQPTGDIQRWNGLRLDVEPDRLPKAAPRARNRLQKQPPVSVLSPSATTSSIPGTETPDQSFYKQEKLVGTNLSNSPDLVDGADTSHGSPGLKRAKAKRLFKHTSDPRTSSPGSLREDFQRDSAKVTESPASTISPTQARTLLQRNRASTPSLDLPLLPKLRKDSPPATPIDEPAEELDWPQNPDGKDASLRSTPELVKGRRGSSTSPCGPRSYGTSSPAQQKPVSTPELGPTQQLKRRSSSPLKHEYDPSSASASCSDSDSSAVEHNEATSMSDDSSTDDELEGGDTPTPLIPLGALNRRRKPSTSGSLYNLLNGTPSPLSSVSQAPYKTVPLQPAIAVKTIASIFCWSEKGSWESLFPDECSITVTPGLIEAFEMSAAHSQHGNPQASSGEDCNLLTTGARPHSHISEPSLHKPLVALELTPLVPIRRGTALDISIRSPPTSDSLFTDITNNNILFRSRSSEECEALYGLINQARINNPTYIALQHARLTSDFSTQQYTSPFAPLEASSRRSWFGFGGSGARSSYRARTIPSSSSPSVIQSTSSFSSAFSAFSALRRFGPSTRFNIARSTVTSRIGSTAESMTEYSGSGTSSPLGGHQIGITNVEITLYMRAQASRWDLVGKAYLTILRPTPMIPLPTPGYAATASGSVRGQQANEKRILVVRSHGRNKGEMLLDVTLGDACFERIMGRGIAMSVWEDGEVGKEGGVVAGRLKVFLMRFNGEFDTAYTFSLVGRPRF